MNCTWKLLGLPLLLTALTMSSVRAGDDKPPPLSVDNKLDLLIKQIGAMQRAMDKQQMQSEWRDEQLELRLKSLERRLNDLEYSQGKAKEMRSNYPSESGTAVTLEQLRDLSNRIAQLERSRTSSSFTPSEMIGPTPPPVGIVVVQNTSGYWGTVRVNGIPYRFFPGQTLRIPDVPAGTFTYEIVLDNYGFLRQNTLNLAPNSERKLTIF